MIHILGKIPPKIIVACSGGPDSMAVVDFLRKGGREVIIAYFNHLTEHGEEAESFVKRYCVENQIVFERSQLRHARPRGMSKEQHWRNERYWFYRQVLEKYKFESPVITCHHLDDQVENWIFTSLHGNPQLIPYKGKPKVIRPFLLTRKAEFENWCDGHNVPYVIDPSNLDTQYMRNHIRHNIVPQALIINPGIHKTIRKKVISEYQNISV